MPAKADPLFTGPTIQDDGGSSDKADLRPYSSTDLSSGTGFGSNGNFFIFIDGKHVAEIINQDSSPIEHFVFSDKVLTASQIDALVNT